MHGYSIDRLPWEVIPVLRILDSYGFPETMWGMRTSIRISMSNKEMLSLCATAGISVSYEHVGKDIVDRVTETLRKHGRDCDDVEITAFTFDGSRYEFVSAIPGIACEDLHGIVIHGNGWTATYGDRREVLAEATLLACDKIIRSRMFSFGIDRTVIELRGFVDALGGAPVCTRDGFFSGKCLKRRRLDGAVNLLRAAGAVAGMYHNFNPLTAMNVNLRKRPRRVDELVSPGPLSRSFVDVEFDPMVKNETIVAVGECFGELLDDGTLFSVSRDFMACARFRRFRSKGTGSIGIYSYPFRTMIVDLSCLGTFVHEYGHLISHFIGPATYAGDFDRIHKMYVAQVLKNMKGRPFNSSYYFKPQEVFARCMESYVLRHHGPCLLLDDVSSSPFHPISPELDAAFDSHMSSLASSAQHVYPSPL